MVAVAVYYDARNIKAKVHDPYGEPARLGSRAARPFLGLTDHRQAGALTGRFGAHMRVSLVNDGPVTFWLQVSAKQRS